MDLLRKLASLFGEDTNALQSRQDDRPKICCARCGRGDIFRINMETLGCRACGHEYTLDEARKMMGTSVCRDCIYHSVNLFDIGIAESCVIWGLDKCRSHCKRKEMKPRYRWTDANRWDKD